MAVEFAEQDKEREKERETPSYTDSAATEKVFLNLTSAGAFGDERLIPAVFQEISLSFHASLTQLGMLTLAGALSSSLVYPISGVLGDSYYRSRIILWSLVGVAISTVALALSASYEQMLFVKAINGVCIGLLVPSLQSLVGDMHDALHRGRGFGTLAFTGIMGAVLGSTLATVLAASSYFGLEGWRFAMLLWAGFIVVIIVGLALFAATKLEAYDESKREQIESMEKKQFQEQMAERCSQGLERISYVLSIPTLRILILPQAVGNVPWMAMTGWVTFYLEAMGFSNGATALLILITGLGFALGTLLGGVIGDLAERADRLRGRIFLAQVAIGLGILLFVWDLEVLPRLLEGQDMIVAGLCYAISLFVTGVLSIGGTGAACNLPIIVSCLPQDYHTSGIAVERFFATVMSAFAAPLVGIIAEGYYDYNLEPDELGPVGAVGADGKEIQPTFQPFASARATIVADSLVMVTTISWLLSILVWTLVYFSYPKDRLSIDSDEEARVIDGTSQGYGTGASSVSMAGSSIPPSFVSTGLAGSTGTLSDQDEEGKGA
ncbi:hypothetical protein GUITHDRAFT_165318 [Guillardia theta CCMP2712]|uniref:Major facilitator superfamily (MFS) profile domain-containing protein n=2 Tax=Guillardia theta TaxID=55529 RepID=L1IPQ0_GUITC|nr:hypothetical protein GUITHDRAFT_165318 [Guillardia theta CCMP2712]EKX38072.1 hypothetical protein GUITHDRAFT_165318 [Guillardia theta CCMP2712]|mmetsp:Transcript_50480/g.157625  ORF Transcript_50480/g.157625 Transcript_50480/m.157625 type:complete len:551 (+) Transcript_50480:74-1726(+)|eukprot:XP_005825052.1 hypothetical protein GUITHDRAFT_165318 [Guillardia theta CCMP2712]